MYIYLLGIIQEICVIINLYNGNLIPNFSEDIEYSIVDLLIILWMIIFYKKIDRIDWILNILCLFSHIQWILHSPFEEWPEWWISEKSVNDIRHRTEYYDTHVMCFSIRLILFLRYYDKKKYKLNLL